jgi:hypothetical protein
MPITYAEAKRHLGLSTDDRQPDVERLISAAKSAAEKYLDRKLYADADAMQAAFAGAADKYAEAAQARDVAFVLAGAITNPELRQMQSEAIQSRFDAAATECRMIVQGMVETDDIKAAMLLLIRHLFDNPSAVETGAGAGAIALPMGFQWLLQSDRASMGV